MKLQWKYYSKWFWLLVKLNWNVLLIHTWYSFINPSIKLEVQQCIIIRKIYNLTLQLDSEHMFWWQTRFLIWKKFNKIRSCLYYRITLYWHKFEQHIFLVCLSKYCSLSLKNTWIKMKSMCQLKFLIITE